MVNMNGSDIYTSFHSHQILCLWITLVLKFNNGHLLYLGWILWNSSMLWFGKSIYIYQKHSDLGTPKNAPWFKVDPWSWEIDPFSFSFRLTSRIWLGSRNGSKIRSVLPDTLTKDSEPYWLVHLWWEEPKPDLPRFTWGGTSTEVKVEHR